MRSIHRNVTRLFPKLPQNTEIKLNNKFHSLNNNLINNTILPNQLNINNNNNSIIKNLLQPNQVYLNLSCGMKVVGKLQRRCKDCYFFATKGRWFIRCKTHPRHKQAQRAKQEKNTWILTSVCQHPKRPWW
uniref:Large ribosomal subunit protein bL36m n=1 Tax=Lysiphlebus testaceipes TaxID=77504 RepID=Q56FJ1_LYSTE|nr:putative mitochondrial ribosomal protein L36 [Lysiphlebus testaceipes]